MDYTTKDHSISYEDALEKDNFINKHQHFYIFIMMDKTGTPLSSI